MVAGCRTPARTCLGKAWATRRISLTNSNCWRGCQSVSALWAIGKRKDSVPTSRSAGAAFITGQASKARSCGDSVEDSGWERGVPLNFTPAYVEADKATLDKTPEQNPDW